MCSIQPVTRNTKIRLARKLWPTAANNIVRGGATETLEGNWKPKRLVVLEFEGVQRAKDWWNSQEYRELKKMRQRTAHAKMIVVEGT